MLKRAMILLVLLSPWLAGASCDGADKFRNSKNFLGVVELGPFPKQAPTVGGYNLYMSEKPGGPFEKVSDQPVLGYSKIMVPMLNPGQSYYFKMTSVSKGNPVRESVPSAVFVRKAVAKQD
jgi:hypothetical protein